MLSEIRLSKATVMLMLMVPEVLRLSELLMLIHSHSNDMLRARRG